MEIGLFVVPFRLPQTDFHAGMEWDLEVVQWAEEFGLSEVWFGEHFTTAWEPSCAPELYIASALRETDRIGLATGAHLAPYHNPVALAHRLMMLDHMAQGRLTVGVGAGAYPGDKQLFAAEDNHAMLEESLEIMKRIWTADGPFKYEGRFWSVDYPDYNETMRGPHWKPFTQPHPRIALAGLSPASGTLAEAGRNGYLPLSFGVAADYLAGHWYRFVEGAEEAGRPADREEWRVIQNVIVADTDAEAYRLALEGGLGQTFDQFMLPNYRAGGMLPIMAPELPPDEVTTEWLVKNKWLVGSPDTVVARLEEQLEISGGFGSLTGMVFEYIDEADAYRHSIELLGTEVLPRIAGISHANQPLSELAPPDRAGGISLGS